MGEDHIISNSPNDPKGGLNDHVKKLNKLVLKGNTAAKLTASMRFDYLIYLKQLMSVSPYHL